MTGGEGLPGPSPGTLVEVDVAALHRMGVESIIRYAGDELNFYVDVNAPKQAMITHMARNAVAPSVSD